MKCPKCASSSIKNRLRKDCCDDIPEEHAHGRCNDCGARWRARIEIVYGQKADEQLSR